MSGGVKAGRSNFLFYNDKPTTATAGAGTYALPVWVVINRIGDLDRSNSKSSTEVDMRSSSTTIVVFGNKNRELSFTYYKKEGAADDVYNVLLDSYENDIALDLAIAEGNIAAAGAGILYDRGPFVVSEMTKAEPIAGVDAFEMTLNVADAETAPGSGITQLYESNLVTV